MPSDRNIDKRKVSVYAEALLASAGEDETAILAFHEGLDALLGAYRGHNALREAFEGDSLSGEARAALAQEAFADFPEGIRSVASVMAARGDIGLLPRVCDEFTTLAEDRLGAVIVSVTTVVELDDHLREVIGDKLAADFGKRAILRESIDRSIVGGIIMSAHGKRIDASVASQLDNARATLAKSPVGGEG